MKRGIVFLCLISAFLPLTAQRLPENELKTKPIFTSLTEAMRNPEAVYRLKLKIRTDSLPEEIFQLINLQELTVRYCKLAVLNARIGELKNLEYLNVSGNHLVRLPETLGQLVHLKILIINRNIIEALPESIGGLHALTHIDAWGNPLYVLPESIGNLQNTLKVIDLRQIDLRDSELKKMEELLPRTRIEFTSTCDCHDRRED